MVMFNGFPRRSIIEQQFPQETAIRAAIEEVEALGAHPLLTDAVILLSQAQEKVADYFDSRVAKCRDCGKPYESFPIDVVVPDAQWKAIGFDGCAGILCAACIVERGAKLPGVTVARLHFEFGKIDCPV